jgi:hypothetical protein
MTMVANAVGFLCMAQTVFNPTHAPIAFPCIMCLFKLVITIKLKIAKVNLTIQPSGYTALGLQVTLSN